MFSYQGKTYMAFGDTFGGPGAPLGTDFFSSGNTPDWRSNSMLVTGDNNPADGLTVDSMISDRAGHAKAILPALQDSTECCIVPTYGTAVGNRIYVHYMSIKTFGPPPDLNDWTCNYSGIAYSDDAGQTWVKSSPMWTATSNFIQVSFVQQGSFTYVFGVPCLGGGGVQLARVPSASLLVLSAYRYWTGKTWSPNMKSAKTIVPPEVGQFSVRYNSYYKKWLFMTTDFGIQLRTADALTGPWSAEQQVFSFDLGDLAFGCNLPYITPSWNDGPDIWFTMTDHLEYDVSLGHTQLTAVGAPSAPRALSVTAPFPSKSAAVTLSWKPPAKSNASKVTGYVVTAYYATDPTYEEQFSLPPVTFKSTATTQTITGLTTGTAYTFVVSAINSRGPGPVSGVSNAMRPT